MLNQIVFVGRLTDIKENKEEKKAKVTLAIPRNYKNENGEYDTDYIPCELNGVIATNTIEYCKKGDLIGIKGRIESENKKIVIKAEKVTFLSSKSSE